MRDFPLGLSGRRSLSFTDSWESGTLPAVIRAHSERRLHAIDRRASG